MSVYLISCLGVLGQLLIFLVGIYGHNNSSQHISAQNNPLLVGSCRGLLSNDLCDMRRLVHIEVLELLLRRSRTPRSKEHKSTHNEDIKNTHSNSFTECYAYREYRLII